MFPGENIGVQSDTTMTISSAPRRAPKISDARISSEKTDRISLTLWLAMNLPHMIWLPPRSTRLTAPTRKPTGLYSPTALKASAPMKLLAKRPDTSPFKAIMTASRTCIGRRRKYNFVIILFFMA